MNFWQETLAILECWGILEFDQMSPFASSTTAHTHVHVNSARAARLFFFLSTNWISCDAFVATRKTPQLKNHDGELKHETFLSTHTSQGRGGNESIPAWLNCVKHVTSVLPATPPVILILFSLFLQLPVFFTFYKTTRTAKPRFGRPSPEVCVAWRDFWFRNHFRLPFVGSKMSDA